jgi:hypothetical protein
MQAVMAMLNDQPVLRPAYRLLKASMQPRTTPVRVERNVS